MVKYILVFYPLRLLAVVKNDVYSRGRVYPKGPVHTHLKVPSVCQWSKMVMYIKNDHKQVLPMSMKISL